MCEAPQINVGSEGEDLLEIMGKGRWIEAPQDFNVNQIFGSSAGPGNFSPAISLSQDPSWVQAITENTESSFKILIFLRDGDYLGYAPFFIHNTSLQFCFGEITIFSYPVKRYVLSGNPYIQSNGESNLENSLLNSLFCDFPGTLPDNAVFFLSAVPVQSRLFELLQQSSPLHRHYYVLPHGPLYQRRSIELSGTYEDYLKKLGAKTRQDLKRTRKRFLELAEEDWELVRFEKEQDVSTFLAHAQRISKRTYQWNLLGLGVRQGGALEKRLCAAAARGWFQSYVLFVKKQPLAFQVGYAYEGVYQAHDIGYDPDWAKLQLGIFLHTEIVTDLLIRCPDLKTFDFLVGDSLHKKRLSTTSHGERHFYLIPKNIKNCFLSNGFRVTNWISRQVGKILESYNLKRKLKNFIRKRFTVGKG